MSFSADIDHLIGCPVLSKWKDNRKWYTGTLVEVVDGFGLVKYDELKLRQEYIPVHLIKASDRLPPLRDRPDTGLVSDGFNADQFKEYAHYIAGRNRLLCWVDKSKLEALQRSSGAAIFLTTGGDRLLAHHGLDPVGKNLLINRDLKTKRTSNDRFQRNMMQTAQDCVYYEERGNVYIVTTTSTVVFSNDWNVFRTCYTNQISFAAWKKKQQGVRAASGRGNFALMY